MDWRDVLPWLGPIGPLLIGYVLAQLPLRRARKRRLKTHWYALRAEMRLCDDLLGHLLGDGKQAPLYRLPVAAYRYSYPVLLAEGDVFEQDVLALGRYFGWVHDINRGLDNAAEANMKKDWDILKGEYCRNRLKAKDLRAKYKGPAEEVANRKIVEAEKGWWREEKLW